MYSAEVIFPFVVPKAAAIHLGTVLITVAAALQLRQQEKNLHLSYLSMALILYLGIHLVAGFVGINPEQSFWSTFERSQGGLGLMLGVLFAFSAATLLTSEAGWRTLYRSVVLAGGIISVAALAYFIGFFDVPYFYRDFGRLAFTLGNAAIFGHYLSVLCALSLALCLADYKIVTRNFLFLEVTIFFCLLLCLVASGTRGGILALAVTTPIILFASPTTTKVKVIIAGISAVVMSLSLLLMWDVVQTRMIETTMNSQAIAYRIDAWEIGWRGILEKPWLGWGSENFISVFGQFSSAIQISNETFDTAHNHFVAIAVGTGLIGLGAYVLVLALIIYQLWIGIRSRDAERNGNAMIAGSIVISYQVASVFIFESIVTQPIFFIAVAYCLSLSESKFSIPSNRTLAMLCSLVLVVALVSVYEIKVWHSGKQLRAVESANNWQTKVNAARLQTGKLRQQELVYLFSVETSQHWVELNAHEKQQVRETLDQLVIDSQIETLNWRTTFHLANAYLRMVSDYPELIDSLQLLVDRTFQLAPERPQSHRLLANYFIVTGQNERATQVLASYLKKNPDRPIMQNMLERLTP